MAKVVVGMSGGVDSTVSVYLLKERGYEVHGAFLHFAHNSSEAVLARKAAEKLGVELHVIHCEEEYESIPQLVIDGYRKGITPNPCATCNFTVKFAQLVKFADENGIEFIATGHYARCAYDEELKHHVILRGAAVDKDQSYALFHLQKQWVPRLIFPCGDFISKSEIREIAAKAGLEQAGMKDSQDLCFLQGASIDDYREFIRKKAPDVFVEGNFIDESGNVLGRHNGYCNYTIGQRKGIGNLNKHRGIKMFVRKIDPDTAEVTLGGRPMTREMVANDTIWFIDFENLPADVIIDDPVGRPVIMRFRAGVQIRYQSRRTEDAIVTVLPGNILKATFEKEVFAITPGQPAAIYLGNRMIGGGFITMDF